MYESHWKLTERPFENWSDPRFYYPSEVHQTALLKLRYAVENRRAAVAMCGDSGIGKSLIVDALAEQLPEPFAPVAKLAFPQLCGDQLLGYVTDELTGASGPNDETPRTSLRRLDDFFADNVDAGRHAVLIVDEAHLLMAPEQLETLRLLLNLQRRQAQAEAAWTLVLVGHATLLSVIERNRALDERMSVKCMLHRMGPEQTAGYIQHRIQVAGGDSQAIFTPEAIETLHVRSGGIPRRINRLADLALMVGYAEEAEQIEAAHIEGVHQELVTVAA
ncbi:ExeA family protein [Roseimaritima ulvae]|uniref:ORC1/DEAH AAA+ ATPase domain-containing protein n=1 Tax=Roseimaritima ulvae TaxID=980254 RepID=A0A5B9QXJ6_9BACT|nr:AAA family ATPase [Roseimaritima ulvae]QEG43738.1 hypothetical protein UC8_57920 [Roseimaritima ulvae]